MIEDLRRLYIVIPVLDDWVCLEQLSLRLHQALAGIGWLPFIVAVDDCSRESVAAGETSGTAVVLRLARNVGHQRAIAVGLDYVLRETDAEVIAVMDADGEDRPEDLPRLLSTLAKHVHHVVVASRRRRSEGRRFSILYAAYKAAFRIMTGEHLDFGNFSVLDRAAARRLMAMHELWLNYPATVMRSRLVVVRVPTDRGHRYAGTSRMNIVGLVIHGLSAIGVFSERAFTRTLLGVAVLAFLLGIGFATGLCLKAVGLATPGWVTTIGAALIIVLVQTAMVAICGLFVVFGNATNVVLLPGVAARTLIGEIKLPAEYLGPGTADMRSQ